MRKLVLSLDQVILYEDGVTPEDITHLLPKMTIIEALVDALNSAKEWSTQDVAPYLKASMRSLQVTITDDSISLYSDEVPND